MGNGYIVSLIILVASTWLKLNMRYFARLKNSLRACVIDVYW